MTSHTTPIAADDRDRMLIIREGALRNGLVDELRRRYADWAVTTCDTYLTAIAEASRTPARAILAGLDATLPRLPDAVAALREAVGQGPRVLLCCEPATEPVARGLIRHGADDYVLVPVDYAELDDALGIVAPEPESDLPPAGPPTASMNELDAVAETLAELDASPRRLLERLAAIVHAAIPASGVQVIVDGSSAQAGDAAAAPVLRETIRIADQPIGRILLGPPAGRPYTAADAAKLTHYATLAGRLIEAARRQRRWRDLAMTDELTGLPNRRCFLAELGRILDGARHDRRQVTVLLFDVDDFKTYNDRFGHDMGDEILRVTGRLFRQHSREQDLVARYGGDEFAVAFWDSAGPRTPGSRHPGDALEILSRFTTALRREKFSAPGPNAQGSLTISGGLATYPWDGATPEALLARADEALLAAKRAGKNRVFLIGDHAGEPVDPA
jgi:diguanylate cyclase (GGDEF)-like protein